MPGAMAAVSRTPAVSLVFLLFGIPAFLHAGQSFLQVAAETNVNQRYTIESISIGGVQIENTKLPSSLRSRLAALVGERCDVERLQNLAVDLRRELHLRAVSQRLLRGSQPDRIRVNFEVVQTDVAFDVSVPKFLYHSQQGWSAELDARARAGKNTMSVGVLSNGDDLTERYSGISARYENARLGTDRVRFGLAFEDYRTQWSNSTLRASPDFDLYRTRRNVAPEVTFAIARPLTVSAGLSFEEMKLNTGGSLASNAITGEVHYGHRFEGNGALQQKLDARYNLRAGARSLGSDYAYSRHSVSVRYEIKSGRQTASDEFTAGAIEGHAPSFERFILGSSSSLRGWDRYNLDPLGGNRVIHNSVTYGYQMREGTGEAFYDSGALWQSGHITPVRHSAGIAWRQGVFVIAMAFPLVEGKFSPIFMAGMNY